MPADRPPQFLFAISTGRSGSDYLKEIFRHVEGCRAEHEPAPTGNRRPMRLYARGRSEPMRRLAARKATAILADAADASTYVETNHCFIKGFGWFLPEHLGESRMGLIVLRRDPERIVESLRRIDCTPLTSFGRNWITTPDKRRPLVPPPTLLGSPRISYLLGRCGAGLHRAMRSALRRSQTDRPLLPGWLDRYERACLRWYVAETLAEAAEFRRRFPGVRTYEVDLDELNTMAGVERMLAHFGLRGAASLGSVVGRPSNLKLHASRSRSAGSVGSEREVEHEARSAQRPAIAGKSAAQAAGQFVGDGQSEP
jgi:hypothetical protein